MRIVYTKHALEKLERPDIKKFGINKKLLDKILKNPEYLVATKYGDFASISQITSEHSLRIVYVIIENKMRIITFHVHRTGRYI